MKNHSQDFPDILLIYPPTSNSVKKWFWLGFPIKNVIFLVVTVTGRGVEDARYSGYSMDFCGFLFCLLGGYITPTTYYQNQNSLRNILVKRCPLRAKTN